MSRRPSDFRPPTSDHLALTHAERDPDHRTIFVMLGGDRGLRVLQHRDGAVTLEIDQGDITFKPYLGPGVDPNPTDSPGYG